MSGSGQSSYTPRESGCADMSFTTVLGTPKRPILAQLRKGHVLQLVLETGQTKIVVAKTNAGQMAGTITTMTQKLIECMEKGYEYEAEVSQVTGLQCSVVIRPK